MKNMIEVRNQWNGKYYYYNHNAISNTKQWDKKLHDNNVTPDMSIKNMCGYCKTIFNHRSSLFYHLAFMNIDIRDRNEYPLEYDIDEYDKNGNPLPFFRDENTTIDDLILDMNSCKLKRNRDENDLDNFYLNFKKMKVSI